MNLDLWQLYRLMFRSRMFETAVAGLWEQGLISGEMHLGLGEEAISAGVIAHLRDGDALALDHRGTPELLMRGVDAVLLLKEFLGRPDGLCRGQGGHMHLFSPELLAMTSGIVGAAGPAAAGFGLAAQQRRPGCVAVAFFGEGAANQGMLLESFNLAVAWKLPLLFVCKDNRWAITTSSPEVTGGKLTERAQGFGLATFDVDGSEVEAVWLAAGQAIERARRGEPAFIHATCAHPEGHFLGDQLLRAARRPLKELSPKVGPLLKAALASKGTSYSDRVKGIFHVLGRIQAVQRDEKVVEKDPLVKTRLKLQADPPRLDALEAEISAEILTAFQNALAGEGSARG
jgi:acetoin:2,6-dichlorophenolindophenol oxidoreductase subunit alpha